MGAVTTQLTHELDSEDKESGGSNQEYEDMDRFLLLKKKK